MDKWDNFDEMKATKRMLYEHNQNKQAILSLQDMLKNLDGLKGMQFNGAPSRGKIGDPTSVVAFKSAELEQRLKNTERLVNIVERALDQLEGIEKEIVIRRYVNGQPWRRIADECYYSRQGAYLAGQRGLGIVCNILFGKIE